MEQLSLYFRDLDDSKESRWKKQRMYLQTVEASRKKRKFSQQDLSRRTKIAQGDISKIETGKSNPSVWTLKRLADGLDCDLSIRFIPKEERYSHFLVDPDRH